MASIAALLVIVDPILLSQSRLVMTETLAAMLVALAVWLWSKAMTHNSRGQQDESRRQFVRLCLIGFVLAMAYLCRPTFLVWAGWFVLITFFVFVKRRASLRQGIQHASAIAIVVGLAVCGWTVRNMLVMGHPIWATSHGGYTLLLSNNESFYDYLHQGQWGTAWDASQFLNAYQHRYDGDPNEADFWKQDWSEERKNRYPVAEHDDDRKTYDAAIATIRRRPGGLRFVLRRSRLTDAEPYSARNRRTLDLKVGRCQYFLFPDLFGDRRCDLQTPPQNVFAANATDVGVGRLTGNGSHVLLE